MTVKRRAVKLGLQFPRIGKRSTYKIPKLPAQRDWAADFSDHRRQWLTLMSHLPESSRKGLRAAAPALYARLYRHDRQWLLLNQPDRLTSGRSGNKVDWKARDRHLSSEAEQIIQKLLRSRFGGRVSSTEIARQLGSPATLQKCREKLPETTRILKDLSETRVEYAVRRIREANGKKIRLRPDLLRERAIQQELHLP
jgi:hypothetical protein